MESDKSIVHPADLSEFREPMVVEKGDRVSADDLCEVTEGWPDWYPCSSPGQRRIRSGANR
jgi:hypothetical protein